jgi:hypothetical protein
VEPKLDPAPPSVDWRKALGELFTTRAELIRLESLAAAKGVVSKVIWGAALGIAALFCWLLLLAGGIGLLAMTTGVAWSWLTLAAAGLHLLVALIAYAKLRRPAPPTFSHTKAEFQRDREWLKTLNPPKSKL